MYMDILEQCQKRHEKGQYQKIIDALEAIPVQERTRRWTANRPVPTTIWRTHISRLAEKCLCILRQCSCAVTQYTRS